MGKDLSKDIRGLYAMIDTAYLAAGEMEKAAVAMMEGGARLLQLRSKEHGSRETLKAARLLRAVTAGYHAKFIVNDRVDIALISGADGVHLGQDDLPLPDARRLLGESGIIGISTHNVDEAKAAEALGADYISFGPVFATKTKKDAQAPKGLTGLEEVRRTASLPIVAIGGITEENLSEVLNAGADSVAIISDILLSKDIASKVSSIISLLL